MKAACNPPWRLCSRTNVLIQDSWLVQFIQLHAALPHRSPPPPTSQQAVVQWKQWQWLHQKLHNTQPVHHFYRHMKGSMLTAEGFAFSSLHRCNGLRHRWHHHASPEPPMMITPKQDGSRVCIKQGKRMSVQVPAQPLLNQA